MITMASKRPFLEPNIEALRMIIRELKGGAGMKIRGTKSFLKTREL
jgi:hypothetical protein